MSQGSFNRKIRFLAHKVCSVARLQTHTKVTTEGTLSGFKEFFLQPIIKDRPNYFPPPPFQTWTKYLIPLRKKKFAWKFLFCMFKSPICNDLEKSPCFILEKNPFFHSSCKNPHFGENYSPHPLNTWRIYTPGPLWPTKGGLSRLKLSVVPICSRQKL